MNNRQSGRRRGRNNNSNNNRSQSGGRGGVDQANRIDSRARGNGAQMIEKYRNLARDAQLAGDRVQTEYYLQFADHYFRVVSDFRARQEEKAAQNGHDRIPDRQREIRGVEDFDGHDDSDGYETEQAEADSGDGEARGQRERRDDEDGRGQRAPRDRGERSERPRRAREPRDVEPAPEPAKARPAEPAETQPANAAEDAAPAPRRRGPRRAARPAGDEVEASGIDSAVLPPAIGRSERAAAESAAPEGAADEGDAPAPKPRRTRRTLAARDTGVEAAE